MPDQQQRPVHAVSPGDPPVPAPTKAQNGKLGVALRLHSSRAVPPPQAGASVPRDGGGLAAESVAPAVPGITAFNDLPSLEEFLKTTALSREAVQKLLKSANLPKFRMMNLLDKYKPDFEIERGKRVADDKARGEQYLTSGYRRINPLLAAFDALNVDPSVHTGEGYDYLAIKDRLLEQWKKIAIDRRYADEGTVDSWDEATMADVYKDITAIQRSWNEFEMPNIPGGTVARGDSEMIYGAYPTLDAQKRGYPDGMIQVAETLTWPGIMSTTVGDPKSHGFIMAKKVIWRFSVDAEHAGRKLGANNPSEEEVTFPLGVKVMLESLLVRVKDKTLQEGEYGSHAEVIAFARLV